MNYPFLDKARSQPDLEDFCQYLEEPLEILQELLTKTSGMSQQTIERIHRIMHKILPEMVDNFLALSFAWRNTRQVGPQGETAKEQLLENLTKVIEEVWLIEDSFNNSHHAKMLVQHKYLQNCGFQATWDIDGEQASKTVKQLVNQFDYAKFKDSKRGLPTTEKNSTVVTPPKQAMNSPHAYELKISKYHGSEAVFGQEPHRYARKVSPEDRFQWSLTKKLVVANIIACVGLGMLVEPKTSSPEVSMPMESSFTVREGNLNEVNQIQPENIRNICSYYNSVVCPENAHQPRNQDDFGNTLKDVR